VPVGEKLLWKDYDFFLNIGGIANISHRNGESFTAFDVCPANRVLNLLANLSNKPFDENGDIAASGTIDAGLLEALNNLDYYSLPYPKSLANEFGTDVVLPLIKSYNLTTEDALRTYTEHIAEQVKNAAALIAQNKTGIETNTSVRKMLVTGGGALNSFLVSSLQQVLSPLNIEIEVPSTGVVQYKEAIVMALLGILRWREENTALSSVTGAKRNSIGGAVWMGQEA
jgi:anhydro-N-acetylmuramic acid kinase